MDHKIPISQVPFHLIVGALTGGIFILVGWLILNLLGIRIQAFGLLIVIGILGTGWLGVAAFAGVLAKRSFRGSTLQIVGSRPGAYVGMFAGGFLGYYISDHKELWAFVGLIAGYLLGRKLGSVISVFIANQLEKFLQVEWPQQSIQPLIPLNMEKIVLWSSFFGSMIYLVIPFMLYAFEIRSESIGEFLPFIEIVALLISLVIIMISILKVSVWDKFVRSRMGGFDTFPFKIVFLILPSIFGLILYFAGSSLVVVTSANLFSSIGFGYLIYSDKRTEGNFRQ